MKFEKLEKLEESENKVRDAFLLKEKKAELFETLRQINAIEHILKRVDEKDKKLADLEAKKLSLIKEVMVEEIKQNNDALTEDEISELVEQTGQKVESKSTGQKVESKSTGQKVESKSTGQKVESKSTGQGSDGDKGNNGKSNGGKDNNSSKDKGSDKSNNGNKGGKGKSKK